MFGTHIKANGKSDTPYRRIEWRKYLASWFDISTVIQADEQLCPKTNIMDIFYLRAFFQYRSTLDFNIEQMHFLVVLGDGALIIDPHQAVFKSLLRGYLVNANINVHFLQSG